MLASNWVNDAPKMKHIATRELGAAIIGFYMGPKSCIYIYIYIYAVENNCDPELSSQVIDALVGIGDSSRWLP